MYESEKMALIKAGQELLKYRLISLSGGNVSVRVGEHRFLVTPSGMGYENLVPEDICVIDDNGVVIEGMRRPSVDFPALLHIFSHIPHVNAIIHTHQVYATAVGLVEDTLPAATTTLINATVRPVNVAPYSSAGSLAMGIKCVEHIGDARAIILKNHGVIAIGKTLKEALYAAIYLEDAAKTYLLAKMVGDPVLLDENQIEEAVKVFEDYGQKESNSGV